MASKLTRRTILASAPGLAVLPATRAFASVWIPSSEPQPVVISSANGNQFTNGATETAVARAYRLITQGADVLDAVIAGVNLNELDPKDASVGYGGLPNAEGVVQLDS